MPRPQPGPISPHSVLDPDQYRQAESMALDALLRSMHPSPGEVIDPILDPAELKEEAEKLAGSLRLFIPAAWRLIEPSPFVANWHIDGIAEHLEAVTKGDILDLLVTMPPRHSKSLIIAVLWPVWEWITLPSYRWVFASYAHSLSVRDSIKRRKIIRSQWFRDRWGDKFHLLSEQDTKIRYENDKHGFMLATSVEGSNTGEGGERICFPYDEVVWTDYGPLSIGDIVEHKHLVKVWSYNLETDSLSLKPVEGWHTNPGSSIVELCLSDGAILRCTPNHRIWTANRGWVEAVHLLTTDILPRDVFADKRDGLLIDAKLSSKFPVRDSRLDDVLDLCDGKFGAGILEITGLAMALGILTPSTSLPNSTDRRSLYSKFLGQLACCQVRFNDFLSLFGCYLGVATAVAAVLIGILYIIGMCTVANVVDSVVISVAVSVPSLIFGRSRPDKRSSHRNVNVHHEAPISRLPFRPLPGVESRVTFVRRGHEDAARHLNIEPATVSNRTRFAANSPDTGYAVQPFKSGYRSPLFVRHVGYSSPVTYCLTVADNHNMYVGGGSSAIAPILVSNCADDPHNVKDSESETVRTETVDWWNIVMSTRRNDERKSARVVVQQRTHEGDVAGDIISKGGYVHLNLPTEFRFAGAKRCETEWTEHATGKIHRWADPRQEPGELLNPKRFSAEACAKAKIDLGDYQFAAQHGQDPTPPEGQIIQSAWLKYYGGPGQPPVPDWTRATHPMTPMLSTDCTFKEHKDTDFVCMLGWAMFGADLYLMPMCVHKRLSFSATIDSMAEMVGGESLDGLKKWPGIYPFMKLKVIEDKANGSAIISTLQHKVPGIFAYNPGGASKESRLQAISWRFRAGNIYLPHESIAPWVVDYRYELCAFPRAVKDDYVDATSQALLTIGGDAVDGAEPVMGTQDSRWFGLGNGDFGVGDDASGYGPGAGLSKPGSKSGSRWGDTGKSLWRVG